MSALYLTALFYDESINQQYGVESTDLWLRITVENLKWQCPFVISVNTVNASTKIDLTEQLNPDDCNFNRYFDLLVSGVNTIASILWGGAEEACAFIIATRCETVEVLTHHLRRYLHKPNIIFLDFFICLPLDIWDAFHLQTFRFNVRMKVQVKSNLVCLSRVVSRPVALNHRV